jgi:hemoglobin
MRWSATRSATGSIPSTASGLLPTGRRRLSGPTTYSDCYGDDTFVVRLHSGNGPHQDMDRRAIACFDQALVDVGVVGDDRLRRVLHDYFAWMTATTMSRYHRSAEDVPDGLHIPRWSWDGLVDG